MYIRRYDKSTDQEIFTKIEENENITFIDVLNNDTINGIIERQENSNSKSYRLE